MTAITYPDRILAKTIWEAGIVKRRHNYNFIDINGENIEDEYRFHTLGIADSAEKITDLIPDMNKDKAYVCGLLHDYGRIEDEFRGGRFHAVKGYDEMISMGYPDIARICISHGFPQQDFEFKNYPKFSLEDLTYAREILRNIIYDDYDYLIQFCDLLFEGLEMVTIEKRVKGIMSRYNLSFEKVELLYNNGIRLKKYFDNKTGTDVYGLLKIKTND